MCSSSSQIFRLLLCSILISLSIEFWAYFMHLSVTSHHIIPLTKANSPFHPSGVGKWVPASAGKVKAGMVHPVSGWTRGVQVKLWDPLRTRAIPERLEMCSRRGAIQIHVYRLTLITVTKVQQNLPTAQWNAEHHSQLTRSNQFQHLGLQRRWPFIKQCLLCFQCSQLP